MAYNPHPEKLRQIREYFEQRQGRFPGIVPLLQQLEAERTLNSAQNLLAAYFAHHAQGDLRSLRQIAAAFADKRLARDLVDTVLGNERLLEQIASLSYPHPIGFDKLVLYQHRGDDAGHGFKLRLHVYWRSPQEIATELIHLHRFEIASSPITGELTNHLYAVRNFEAGGVATSGSNGPTETLHAYTGYERDRQGVLHKRRLGCAELGRLETVTFVPGQTYAQGLEHAHYVETNAETGHTNGDICSTIFIHGPGLTDSAGRTLPILFEKSSVADSVITPIANLRVDELDSALRRYRRLLDESLSYYDWLYDEKYGRNLSVGMVAGYLISEAFETTRPIEMWEKHRSACLDVLGSRTQTLRRLVEGELLIEQLPSDDRTTRYLQQLVNKSWDHPRGRRDWLAQYGNLVQELERYLGALIGDYARNPNIKVLKPIWDMDSSNLVGGAHYGHVGAMLEAVRAVAPMLLEHFRGARLRVEDKHGEGPMTELDTTAERAIEKILSEHFPDAHFIGEEGASRNAPDSQQRWMVDAIDGTRNFVHGHKSFAISIAHQQRGAQGWITTDAVVALPAHGEIYWAERGRGAFHIGWDGREVRLRVPTTLTVAATLSDALVDLSVRGLGERELALHQGLMQAGATRRQTGSASLMLSMVSGTGNTGTIITANAYDVAAGLLVAEEAGAHLSSRTFTRDARLFTLYVAGESLPIHDALLEIVDQVLAAS